MPIDYARQLTAATRSARSDRHLGLGLAFIAGATNAGAFLAVGMYTSHVTGMVSSIADHLVLGQVLLALGACGAVLCFLLGAVTSSLMIQYGRRRGLQSLYAWPLLLEAGLLLVFGLMGAGLARIPGLLVPATVMLLCFMMGLQNAVITNIAGAAVRTTHLTGVVTDLGVELGRLLYWNRDPAPGATPVLADRDRLSLLAALCAFFMAGSLVGALGFKHVGYATTLPLALLLVAMAIVPALDEVAGARNEPLG